MARTKAEEIREMLQRCASEAIGLCCVDMTDQEASKVIRSNRSALASRIAWHVTEEYRLLELMDIVE